MASDEVKEYKVILAFSDEINNSLQKLAKRGYHPTMMTSHPNGYLYVMLERTVTVTPVDTGT